MQRTIRLRLRPDRSTEVVLERTVEQYTRSFNHVARHGFDHDIFNGVALHKATYYPLRERTDLPSQLVISSRMKATEALQSVHEIKKKINKMRKARAAGKRVRVPNPPRCPESRWCSIRYDARSYRVSLKHGEVSLVTVDGRKRLSFTVPKAFAHDTTWNTASADLCRDRQGRWWLHVVVNKAAAEVAPTDEVLGVDLGVNNPAVDSQGRVYGNANWRRIEERYAAHRDALQSKGTKSAKRRLKKISGRQRRFRRDCDHVLSKQIVLNAAPGSTIAMEDLTGIRQRVRARKGQRKRLHGWSFHQLQAFVTYKGQARGVGVEYVDPRYTSQTCSQCDHRERGNRPSQAVFRCKACGFEAHADHNASINIRNIHIASRAACHPASSSPPR